MSIKAIYSGIPVKKIVLSTKKAVTPEYISPEKMNIIITKLCFMRAGELIGFDSKTGNTMPRCVVDYEAVLFVKDGGYFVVDGRKYKIHAGDIRIHKPGQTVYSHRYGDVYTVHFRFDGENAGKNEITELFPTLMPCFETDIFIKLFNELISATIENTPENALLLKYKSVKLVYFLYKCAQQFTASLGSDIKVRTSVDNAVEYMREHLSDPIGLDEIGRAVGLHPVYFHRIFKKSTDCTPISYLNRLRLSKAKQLLLTTDLKTAAIAEKCGFSDSSYFIAKFKAMYKITPSAFRTKIADENKDIL